MPYMSGGVKELLGEVVPIGLNDRVSFLMGYDKPLYSFRDCYLQHVFYLAGYTVQVFVR